MHGEGKWDRWGIIVCRAVSHRSDACGARKPITLQAEEGGEQGGCKAWGDGGGEPRRGRVGGGEAGAHGRGRRGPRPRPAGRHRTAAAMVTPPLSSAAEASAAAVQAARPLAQSPLCPR